MTACALALLAGVSSCGEADPCDGFQGCITARVEGALTGLDQLRVSLGGSQMMASAPGGSFDLPVRLAILLPTGTVSPASLTVDGLTAAVVRGSSGPQAVPFNPAGKTSYTFTLAGGSGGDGGADGPPPGVVSFTPTLVDFGKIQRGVAPTTKSAVAINETDHAVSGAVSVTAVNGDPFSIANMPACLGGNMGSTFTLAAGASCSLDFAFKPPTAGSFKQDISIALDDGEMIGFTLTGAATPVWTAETLSDGSTLEGVWGSSHADLYAVGHNAQGGVYHSTSPGVWAHYGTTPSDCLSVSGFDAAHVFVGCAASTVLWSTGPGNWRSVSPGGSASVRGIWAGDLNTSYAAFDSPDDVYRVYVDATTSGFVPLYDTVASAPMLSVCSAGTRLIGVGANGTWYVGDTLGGTFVLQTSLGFDLNGCWMPDPNNVFIVGRAPVGPNGERLPGLLEHCTLGTSTACVAQTPATALGTLSAIAGRVDGTTHKMEIWVVGSIGGEVLFSDGMGTWMDVPTPQNQAMNGVWVNPAGNEVVTVGLQGQINHLY